MVSLRSWWWLLAITATPATWALKGPSHRINILHHKQQPLELEGEFVCPDYSWYAYQKHEPFSEGHYELPYQRPVPACRKFNLSEVEETIKSMRQTVRDPDLFRLFENCFPNTLDTAITWKGVAKKEKKSSVFSRKEEEDEEVRKRGLLSPTLDHLAE